MRKPSEGGDVSESSCAVDKDTCYENKAGSVAEKASDEASQQHKSVTKSTNNRLEADSTERESSQKGKLYQRSPKAYRQHSQSNPYTDVPEISLQLPTTKHRRTNSNPTYSLSPYLSNDTTYTSDAHGERISCAAGNLGNHTDKRGGTTSPLSPDMNDSDTHNSIRPDEHVQPRTHTRTLKHTQSGSLKQTPTQTQPQTQPQGRARTPNRCSGSCTRDSLTPSAAYTACQCTQPPAVVGVHSLDTKRQQKKMSSISTDYGASPTGIGSGRTPRGRPGTHLTGASPGNPGIVVGRVGNVYKSRSNSRHRRHSMTTTLQETHFSMLKWHSPQTASHALTAKGRRVSDANTAGFGGSLLGGSSSESDAQPYLELARELVQLDLFAGTSSEFLSVLADNFVPKTYRRGDQIVMFGETGVTMFYLFQGTVDVMSGDREVSYTRLSDGAIFGEIALLFSVPRTATIIAVEKCICFVLNKEKLNAIMKDHPTEAKKIREVGARRYALYQSQNSTTEKQATRRNTDPNVVANEWGGVRRTAGALEHGAADKSEAILKLGLSPNVNTFVYAKGEGEGEVSTVISQVNVLHDLSQIHAQHPHSDTDMHSHSSNNNTADKASRGLGSTLDVQLGSTNDPRKIGSASVERSQVYMTSPVPIANAPLRANSTGPTSTFSIESCRESDRENEEENDMEGPQRTPGERESSVEMDHPAAKHSNTHPNTTRSPSNSSNRNKANNHNKYNPSHSPHTAHATQSERLSKSESLDTYSNIGMQRSESSPSGTLFNDGLMSSSGVVVGAGDALGRSSVGHHRSSSRSSMSMLKRHSSSDPFKRSTSEINLKSLSASDNAGTHPNSNSGRYSSNTNVDWSETGDGSSGSKYDQNTGLSVDENTGGGMVLGGSSPNINFRSPLAKAHRARDFNRLESPSEDRSKNSQEGQGRGSVDGARRPLQGMGRTNSDSQVFEGRNKSGLESSMAALKITDSDTNTATDATTAAVDNNTQPVVAEVQAHTATQASHTQAQKQTQTPTQTQQHTQTDQRAEYDAQNRTPTPMQPDQSADTTLTTGMDLDNPDDSSSRQEGSHVDDSAMAAELGGDQATMAKNEEDEDTRRMSIDDEKDSGCMAEPRAMTPTGELESSTDSGIGAHTHPSDDRGGSMDTETTVMRTGSGLSEDDRTDGDHGDDADGSHVEGYNENFDIGGARRSHRRISIGPDKVNLPTEEAVNTSISSGMNFHKTPVDRIRSAAIRKRSPSIAVFSSEMQEQLRNMDFSASASHTPSNLSEGSTSTNTQMDTPIMDSEYMAKVFSFLSVGDRYRCMAVCRKWKDIAQGEVVWHNSSFAEQNRLVNDDVLMQIMSSYGDMVCNLSLKNCWAVSDEGLEVVALKANLNEISLFSCWEVSSAGLQMLGENCKNIQHINLNNCRKITDVGMMHLTNNCIGLRSIQLSYCKNLTEVTLNYILARCRKLQHLNIHRCSSISNEGMKLFRQHPAHQLLTLNLSDCFDIDDDALEDIIAGCDILEDITLSFCSQLTTEAMSTLSRCATMKRMDLSSCGNAVNDSGVKKLVEGDITQNIAFLNLRNCYGLTGAGLRLLDDKCSNLEYVNITNLKKITEEDIKACTNIKKIENVAPLDITRIGSPLPPRRGLQAGNNQLTPGPAQNIPKRTFGPAAD